MIRIRRAEEVAVEPALSRHRERIARLLPDAEVVHVGATAIPGALTKGDLDVMVRVPAGGFDAAASALRSAYSIHQPENWTETYASFVDPGATEPPVGVQLVTAGSPEERIFEPFIALLRDDPALLEEYNALKRRLDGADYERYTREKGEFVERVLATD